MAIYEVYKESLKAGTDGKIELRYEQKTAVHDAKVVFSKPFSDKRPFHKFLWNAKMRFGKTLCAMQLAKEMADEKGIKRTLIVTHRPVVNKSWAEDFEKIFEKSPHWQYGTKFEKDDFGNFDDLEKFVAKDGNHYVFFASMQYLRRSELVNEGGDKDQLKKKILQNNWDLVVVDEAHEGTLTVLGSRVVEMLSKPKTCVLHLSGTPFNLYDDFDPGEIFTWDYIAEQRAKRDWAVKYPMLSNPYAELPEMKIFTYDLGKLVKGEGFVKENAGFMFAEFFRTWTGNTKLDGAKMPGGAKGKFVYEKSVKDFLDLLCKKDDTSNYPFSTDEYRKNFKHTLWIVPGVKEAKALEALLKGHPVFKRFNVVNVAGNSDDDVEDDDALDRVRNAIGTGQAAELKYTITLSCARLTTGVTVPQWTAVLYMKGSENTNAATYMQTIFRVQTPYHTDDGRMKAEAYVFDFAPDRSLKMLAETARFFAKTKNKDKLEKSSVANQRELDAMKELLDFCPVIAHEGGTMKKFEDANTLFAKLSEAKIDRVVQRGFDDIALYNVEELLKMDPDAVNKLLGILGKTKGMSKATRIDLNAAGLTGKKPKPGRAGGDEDEDHDEDDAEAKKAKAAALRERKTRIDILRGVSIRIPLLMFGAEVKDEDKDVTIDNFTDEKLIDEASWTEFMPHGFTRKNFDEIKSCYDPVVFKNSWKRYRQLAREADSMPIEERIKAITTIFGYFQNPNKETVLTPWRVVNMHMSDTIGGWCFYNEKFDGPNLDKEGNETPQPRWVEQNDVTKDIFCQVDENGDTSVKVLEINSKSGLYPLYVAYSLYRSIRPKWEELIGEGGVLSLKDEQALWDKILQENIFVICNTPMAARITERTLRGFRKVRGMHIKDEKLVEQATTDQDALVKKLNSEKFWFGKGIGEMKFNAIVGNPPYQVIKGDGRTGFASAVYPYFLDVARCLCQGCVSMIMPSRWMTKTGQGVSEKWCDDLIRSNHFVCMFDFHDAKDCFPGVEIKGGVCYFLYNGDYSGKCRFSIRMLGKDSPSVNYLDEYGAGIVVRDVVARKIVDRVRRLEGDYFNNNTFASYVGPVHLFDKDGQLGTGWKGFSDKKDSNHCIKYYLNRRIVERGFGWITRTDIPKGEEVLPLHKVYIPEAYGAGEGFPHQILGVPFYGEPNSVCSETYLAIGYDQTKHKLSKKECENIVRYIKTRFFRFMVYVKKRTQHAVAAVYQFVPLQDFTEKSDIDWSRSVEDINRQIYDKYKLLKPERDFIDKMIKPME